MCGVYALARRLSRRWMDRRSAVGKLRPEGAFGSMTATQVGDGTGKALQRN
jgi:hypothetical protein